MISPLNEDDKRKRSKEKKEVVTHAAERSVDTSNSGAEKENVTGLKEHVDLKGVAEEVVAKLDYRSSKYRAKMPGYDQKLAAKKAVHPWDNNSRRPKPLLNLTETRLHPSQLHTWEGSIQHKARDYMYRGAFKKPQQVCVCCIGHNILTATDKLLKLWQ